MPTLLKKLSIVVLLALVSGQVQAKYQVLFAGVYAMSDFTTPVDSSLTWYAVLDGSDCEECQTNGGWVIKKAQVQTEKNFSDSTVSILSDWEEPIFLFGSDTKVKTGEQTGIFRLLFESPTGEYICYPGQDSPLEWSFGQQGIKLSIQSIGQARYSEENKLVFDNYQLFIRQEKGGLITFYDLNQEFGEISNGVKWSSLPRVIWAGYLDMDAKPDLLVLCNGKTQLLTTLNSGQKKYGQLRFSQPYMYPF